MFFPVSSLLPVEMSPQHLYHMIEGQCQQLRQLACSDPARLSSMVWLGLDNLKKQVEQFIDHERRQQQWVAVSGAAALVGNLTSEGVPLSSLMAPVPVSASRPGRPSSKRALAALEGQAARKMCLALPAEAVAALEGDGKRKGAGRGSTRADSDVSSFALTAAPTSVFVSAAASVLGGSAAVASPAAASADVLAPVSSFSSFAPAAAAAAASSSSAACAAPAMRSSRRGLVPRVFFEG